jgi:hypothetical protein
VALSPTPCAAPARLQELHLPSGCYKDLRGFHSETCTPFRSIASAGPAERPRTPLLCPRQSPFTLGCLPRLGQNLVSSHPNHSRMALIRRFQSADLKIGAITRIVVGCSRIRHNQSVAPGRLATRCYGARGSPLKVSAQTKTRCNREDRSTFRIFSIMLAQGFAISG